MRCLKIGLALKNSFALAAILVTHFVPASDLLHSSLFFGGSPGLSETKRVAWAVIKRLNLQFCCCTKLLRHFCPCSGALHGWEVLGLQSQRTGKVSAPPEQTLLKGIYQERKLMVFAAISSAFSSAAVDNVLCKFITLINGVGN